MATPDWFAVTLAAGERYGISVTGTTLSDPWLRVYNSSGTELASDRYNYDGVASLAVTATTAGTYYISAAHSYNSSYYTYTGRYTVAVQGDDYRADTATTRAPGGWRLDHRRQLRLVATATGSRSPSPPGSATASASPAPR